MNDDQINQIETVCASLSEQRKKLRSIHNQYATGYDAAFEEQSAYARLQRWLERTNTLVSDLVSSEEAARFQRAIQRVPPGRGSWRWGEVCEYFDTVIDALLEDILENPDDTKFRWCGASTNTTTASTAKATNSIDVFLSYSSLDKDEARAVDKLLTKQGKTTFLAERSIQPGDNFPSEIREALQNASQVWILVSPNSIQSTWVQREMGAAWGLGKRIVPILLRCAAKSLPESLSEVHAIDFHNVAEYVQRL